MAYNHRLGGEDRNMNEKETHILPEQIPVEEFQPIDIFQEPPKKRRLMRRISAPLVVSASSHSRSWATVQFRMDA